MPKLWRRRLLPATSAAVSRDRPLDGLRGLCAALVFYAHIFIPMPLLDPRWAPSARFWWFNLGEAAVMMFFVLSGYVIGLTVTQPATGVEVRRYLARRAWRIVPVCTAAVLLSWLLQPETNARTVLGNLLFLQNDAPWFGDVHVPTLLNNGSLWSLNYEVVYYFGFIALWLWRPRVGLVGGLLIVVVLARCAGLGVSDIFGRFACGAFYWLGGLSVAWLTQPPPPAANRSRWPSALLGAHAIWTLAPLRSLIPVVHLGPLLWPTPVAPHRLDFLPATLWVLLAATGRAPRWERRLGWFCLGWGAAGFTAYATTHTLVEFDFPAAASLMAAAALWRWQPSRDGLARLAPFGAVSFAFYAVALPLEIAQRELLLSFSGSALTFAARAIALLLLTLGLAWLVERKFCPWLRRSFRPAASGIFSRETGVAANPAG